MRDIIYAGLHLETISFLCNSNNFNILGVAYIDSFSQKTLNPANIIFKVIYYLRRIDKARVVELFLLWIWFLVKNFSSSVFYKYKDYLLEISSRKIKILNFRNKKETADYIKRNQVDLLLVNTWEILPSEIIFSPKFGTVNVHPSRLPKYRGALPTLWSLKNKDSSSAITYMLLDKSIDGGSIISQHDFKLEKNENWFGIERKATEIIKQTLVNDLVGYLNGDLSPFPQGESGVSFTKKYDEYRFIDWDNEFARDIYNKTNLYPFIEPGIFCHTLFNGKRIFIKSSKFLEKNDGLTITNKSKFFISKLNLVAILRDGVVKMRLFIDIDFLTSCSLILSKKPILNFGK